MTDDGVLRDIVAASGVQRDDHILEVGPGTGNLTRHLLSTGARVTAIEKDDRLVERLKVDFATVRRLVACPLVPEKEEGWKGAALLRGALHSTRQALKALASCTSQTIRTQISSLVSD